jgi:hypothetical protein
MIGTFGHIVKNTGITGLYSGVCTKAQNPVPGRDARAPPMKGKTG